MIGDTYDKALFIGDRALEEACKWIFMSTYSCPLEEGTCPLTEDEINEVCNCQLREEDGLDTCRVIRMERPEDRLYCWMRVFRAIAEKEMSHD